MIEILLNNTVIARDSDFENLIARLVGLGYISRSTAWNMVYQASRGNSVKDTFNNNTVIVRKAQ